MINRREKMIETWFKCNRKSDGDEGGMEVVWLRLRLLHSQAVPIEECRQGRAEPRGSPTNELVWHDFLVLRTSDMLRFSYRWPNILTIPSRFCLPYNLSLLFFFQVDICSKIENAGQYAKG